MALKSVNGDIIVPLEARTTSTNSDSMATPGGAAQVLYGVHVTEASGTSPTLDAKLQESGDGETWTDIPGSDTDRLTGVGNECGCAVVTDDLVRVVLTIGGDTPSFTCAVAAVVAGA